MELAVNAIKYAHPLSIGNLSPFYDIRELVHKILKKEQRTGIESKDVQRVLKGFYKSEITQTFDMCATNAVVQSKSIRELINEISIASDGLSSYVRLGKALSGTYDLVQKLPRGVVFTALNIEVDENSMFKLASVYDGYAGENSSVALKGKSYWIAIEVSDAGTGVMGKRDIFITVVDEYGRLFKDRLSKYKR